MNEVKIENVTILETWDTYENIPHLFYAESDIGRCIGYYIKQSDRGEQVYSLAKITPLQLYDLKNSAMPIHDYVKDSEEIYLICVKGNDVTRSKPITFDWLYSKGYTPDVDVDYFSLSN